LVQSVRLLQPAESDSWSGRPNQPALAAPIDGPTIGRPEVSVAGTPGRQQQQVRPGDLDGRGYGGRRLDDEVRSGLPVGQTVEQDDDPVELAVRRGQGIAVPVQLLVVLRLRDGERLDGVLQGARRVCAMSPLLMP
jgi:hypothetical protein